MRYVVLVRIDPAGECPVLAHDDTELLSAEGGRWRLIGETDDHGQAVAWTGAEHARCELLEQPPW